jgi:hypothetical protein
MNGCSGGCVSRNSEILVASKDAPLEFAADEQSRKADREDSQRKIRQ